MIAAAIGSVAIMHASLVVLALVFVPLERAFNARPDRRIWRAERAPSTSRFFVGQYLVWSALALTVLAALRGQLDLIVPPTGRAGVAALPLAVQVAPAVIAGDLVYAWHRACHAVPLLWRFHAVHHTTAPLDWLAAHREHPLAGIGWRPGHV